MTFTPTQLNSLMMQLQFEAVDALEPPPQPKRKNRNPVVVHEKHHQEDLKSSPLLGKYHRWIRIRNLGKSISLFAILCNVPIYTIRILANSQNFPWWPPSTEIGLAETRLDAIVKKCREILAEHDSFSKTGNSRLRAASSYSHRVCGARRTPNHTSN